MTIHIGAKVGEVAETVLMPGDPLRAKYIAETKLKNVHCYSEVRGMFGFTGTYQGRKVSVQGSGMGIPSISIYVNELISTYGAKNIIRVGSCGAMQQNIQLRDIILAQAACTDSAINRLIFSGMDYAPIADFDLLYQAHQLAEAKGIKHFVGNTVSTDTFYDDGESWRLWAEYGVMAVEMEAAALYTLGAKFGIRTLAILTVSDQLLSKETCTPEDRETTFDQMVEIALDLA